MLGTPLEAHPPTPGLERLLRGRLEVLFDDGELAPGVELHDVPREHADVDDVANDAELRLLSRRRLLLGGHDVVGFDPAEAARKVIEEKGAQSADSLEALVGKLKAPRVVWLMVPAGAVTDGTITALTNNNGGTVPVGSRPGGIGTVRVVETVNSGSSGRPGCK